MKVSAIPVRSFLMKREFDSASARKTPEGETVLHLPLRWPGDKGMMERSMRAGENPWRDVRLSDINAVTFAAPSEATFSYAPVYLIAEGQKHFMTFLTAAEETDIRAALATRDFFKAGPSVRASELNYFENAKDLLIDPSRIHRMFDGPEQHNDDLLFKIVFDNNNALNISTRDPEFDSEAEVKAANIPVPPDETPRQKWFREADEGAAIGNAMEARIKNQRVVLNKFLYTVAEAAPQLYGIEGTKFSLFTRPGDIEKVFIYTEQADGARVTFKKSEGEVYGHSVDKTAYFTSPENAIWGVELLTQKMKAAQPRPQAGNPPAP